VINKLQIVLANLPQEQSFNVGWEPEYYGAIHLIAKKCNVKNIRPYAPHTWVHGWIIGKEFISSKQILLWGSKKNIHFVHTKEQKKYVRMNGYNYVMDIGAPFLYTDNSEGKRITNSVLIIPHHGLKQAKHISSPIDYIESVLKELDSFEFIVACIHADDAEDVDIIRRLDKLRIPYIIGARANDKNSLNRMRKIFSSFEYTVSDTLGSHIAYSAYCGCKVSIYGNYYERSHSEFHNDPWYKNNKDILDYEITKSTEKYARENYGFLFSDPWLATANIKWAQFELGYQSIRSAFLLKHLFGWTSISRGLYAAINAEFPNFPTGEELS
jgi:hypothetical protein